VYIRTPCRSRFACFEKKTILTFSFVLSSSPPAPLRPGLETRITHIPYVNSSRSVEIKLTKRDWVGWLNKTKGVRV